MRVPDKPPQEYPWYLSPFFWNQKRKYGQVLKPGLLWGRSPLLFTAVAILYGVLERRGSPNLSSKFNSALDVPAQGFCTIPQANAVHAPSAQRTSQR